MHFGCWNVQGISTKVDILPIELDRYNIDVVVFSETKKKGKGIEEMGQYIHLWSGVKKHQRAKAGVSVAIKKSLKKKILRWNFISERIISVELNLFGREVVIIGVYAPTNDSEEYIKDDFWNQLTEFVEKIPKRKELFIMGDINARIGKKEQNEIVGRYGETERNDNGDRLIEMCEQSQLKITNNFFQHREIHTFTWHQETRRLKSIIDYILVRQRSSVKIQDVRVYRGAECGSDHHLVRAKCYWHWKDSMKEIKQNTMERGNSEDKQERFKVILLQDESIRQLYYTRTNNELDESFNGTAEEIYEYIKQRVKKVAYETLGMEEKRKKRNSYWMTDDISKEIDNKKKAYSKWISLGGEQNRAAYKVLKNKVNHMIRTAKITWWERKCADINAQIGFKGSAQAWRTISEMKIEEKNKTNLQLIQMKEWTDYYKRLLNKDNEAANETDEWSYYGSIEEITKEEILTELKNIKNNKAPGPGAMNGELLKYGGSKLVTLLARMFNYIVKEGTLPEEMSTGYITSIFKKGDRRECGNYRGICVTNACMKMFGRILRNRLEKQYTTCDEQCGFTTGKSCTDQIFTIRQLIEKSEAKQKEWHMTFIDLEKAYDSVPRTLLYKTLQMANIDEKLINIIRLLYENNKCQVKVGSNLSNKFGTSKGLLQGCSMSPTLFKIFIDVILKDWTIENRKKGLKISGEQYLLHLLFADDQVIMADNFKNMEHLLREIVKVYEKWGLKINYRKTEYMASVETDVLSINGYEISKVQHFKYLGSIVECNGTSEMEIERRISETRKIISILNPILWSRYIIAKTKRSLFNSLIQSVLLYGADTWTIKKAKERKILATEMDYWRRAARISRLEKRRNTEVREIMDRKRNVIDRIDEMRLTWYGHVKRMNDARLPKILLEWEPPGRQKRGRPRKRWRDRLVETMRVNNLTEEETLDRGNWRNRIKKIFG